MRYEEFRDSLRGALEDVGLGFAHARHVVETVELGTGRQCWEGRVDAPPGAKVDPFYVSAAISFRWSPLESARSSTCEEDLLTELVGRRASRATKTSPRFVRVDLNLAATLPYGSTTPVPQSDVLSAWTTSVSEHLDEILTDIRQRQGRVTAVLGHVGEVEAGCRCAADGVLSMTGLSVSAFRLVRVPRVWDDPERRQAERSVVREMERLAVPARAAFDCWAQGIAELAAWLRYSAPPADARPIQPSFDDDPDSGGSPETIH